MMTIDSCHPELNMELTFLNRRGGIDIQDVTISGCIDLNNNLIILKYTIGVINKLKKGIYMQNEVKSIQAIIDGHPDTVQDLLTRKIIDLNVVYDSGWTVLSFLVDKGDRQTVENILNNLRADMSLTNQMKEIVQLNNMQIAVHDLREDLEYAGAIPGTFEKQVLALKELKRMIIDITEQKIDKIKKVEILSDAISTYKSIEDNYYTYRDKHNLYLRLIELLGNNAILRSLVIKEPIQPGMLGIVWDVVKNVYSILRDFFQPIHTSFKSECASSVCEAESKLTILSEQLFPQVPGVIFIDRTTLIFEINDNVLVKYNGSDADVTIPETVTRIGSEAFNKCSNLKSITISSKIEDIHQNAFMGLSPEFIINIQSDSTEADVVYPMRKIIEKAGINYHQKVRVVPFNRGHAQAQTGGGEDSTSQDGDDYIPRRDSGRP